ncbi:MAG: hypothetical protein FWF72_01745 [Paludibacter sp.]|nr:hypothetical protein [Paludibacter sp.]
MKAGIFQPIIKMLLPAVIDNLDSVNSAVRMQLENVALPANAVCAAYFCMCSDDGVAHIATCTLDANDKIVSVENSQKVTDFVQNLIKLV